METKESTYPEREIVFIVSEVVENSYIGKMGITLTETFLAGARTIGTVFEDQHLVVPAMIHMMRKTIKKIQSLYVKDLLYKLHERRMGTAEVVNLATRLAGSNRHQRDMIVGITMKAKIRDAWGCVRKTRHEEQATWRTLKTKLQAERRVQAFNRVWAEEKARHFQNFREKRKQKVEWIKRKYYRREEAPDEYKGITVCDQEIGDRFETEPVCYGGVIIGEAEREILKVHPKFTVFDKVDVVDTEAEIEKSLAKIRWTRIEEDRKRERERSGIQEVNKKETFNVEEKRFDFRGARSTELPFNSRTHIPGAIQRDEETRLQNLRIDLTRIVEEFAETKEVALTNLTDEQKKGLAELKKRGKNDEIVVFQTDKSGKLAVDTPENYKETATPHIEGDEVVTEEEYDATEKLINAHSVFWLKMLQVAKDSGDAKRYKTSMRKENSRCASLYTFRKDHKPCEDMVKGPPVRPLCDVSDSYGHKLSYFISTILKEITDDAPTVCESTEDMMAAIKSANDSGKIGKDTVVGSLDVVALYPSLDLDFTIEKVTEEFFESKVEIDGVDYEELGLYLSLHRDEDYLLGKGIMRFCPRRKNRYGAPPKITASGIKVEKEERFKAWIIPPDSPDEAKQRVMLTEALKIVLEVIMKNHIYDFNNEMRRQKEGGAIGMDITGELAKVFMVWWDKQILQKLRDLEIGPVVYKRYVDDVNMATDAVDEGVEYVGGALVRNEDRRIDGIEPDERTFNVIREVGNEIHRSIQLTSDVPSGHADRKVPILDLKCWKGEVEVGDDEKDVLLHEFYMKEVSSKSVIHREAAFPLSNKRMILTQECLRILMNCHDLIGWAKISEHLTYFMARMQAAGYDKSFRFQVLKSAIHAYDSKQEEERRGGAPMYRARGWRRNERRREREKKKKEWYKKGGRESVMFVQATPDSELRRRLQEEIDRRSFKIKVVEKSGTRLVRMLQKNNPFKRRTCRDAQRCMVCKANEGGACRESGVTYKINCLGERVEEPGEMCVGFYQGETYRNGFSRGCEHENDLNDHKENSALWKHCVDKHQSVQQNFEMMITDRSRNDATKRQILEAVRIQRANAEQIINGRSEWNSNRVPRVVIERM